MPKVRRCWPQLAMAESTSTFSSLPCARHMPESHATAAGRRVCGRAPAFSFRIAPLSLVPGAPWLPPRLRKLYWRLGAAGWEEISLLRRIELEGLFGPAQGERFGGVVKSWVCVRAPGAV